MRWLLDAEVGIVGPLTPEQREEVLTLASDPWLRRWDGAAWEDVPAMALHIPDLSEEQLLLFLERARLSESSVVLEALLQLGREDLLVKVVCERWRDLRALEHLMLLTRGSTSVVRLVLGQDAGVQEERGAVLAALVAALDESQLETLLRLVLDGHAAITFERVAPLALMSVALEPGDAEVERLASRLEALL